MAESLFLRLSPTGVATWGAFDASGRVVGGLGRGPLESARWATANRRCTLLVDSVDILTTQADLPAGSQARLRQIAPFSLEESLAEDVEELVFAIGARLPSGATQVAAIKRQRLEAALAQLRGAGIVPNAVCSDADGVPEIPATLVLVIEDARIVARKPGAPPTTFDGLKLREAIRFMQGDDEAAHLRHIRVFADETACARFQVELTTLGERFASAEVKLLGDGAFPYLAATLAQKPGINLLQGPYAPKSNWLALLKPWRVAASLGVATLLLALALRGADFLQLARTDAQLTEILSTACQRAVGQTNLSACQREVRQRSGTQTVGDSFLTTLGAIAGARGSGTRIDALSYRNGTLNLQLIAPSVAALDEFTRALEQTRRFDVEIEAANQVDGGTEGRIRIVGARQ